MWYPVRNPTSQRPIFVTVYYFTLDRETDVWPWLWWDILIFTMLSPKDLYLVLSIGRIGRHLTLSLRMVTIAQFYSVRMTHGCKKKISTWVKQICPSGLFVITRSKIAKQWLSGQICLSSNSCKILIFYDIPSETRRHKVQNLQRSSNTWFTKPTLGAIHCVFDV